MTRFDAELLLDNIGCWFMVLQPGLSSQRPILDSGGGANIPIVSTVSIAKRLWWCCQTTIEELKPAGLLRLRPRPPLRLCEDEAVQLSRKMEIRETTRSYELLPNANHYSSVCSAGTVSRDSGSYLLSTGKLNRIASLEIVKQEKPHYTPTGQNTRA